MPHIPLVEQKIAQPSKKKANKKKKVKKRKKEKYTKLLETKINEIEGELRFLKNQIELAKVSQDFEDGISKIMSIPDNERRDIFIAHGTKQKKEFYHSKLQKEYLESQLKKWIDNSKIPLVKYFTGILEHNSHFFAEEGEKADKAFDQLKKDFNIGDVEERKIKELKPEFEILSENFKK